MDENMEVETLDEGTEGGVVTAEEETGAEAEESAGEKEQEAAEPAKQSREDNARFQAARKAGEAAGWKKAQERYSAAVAKLGLTDPDGGGAIDSLDVLESYADKTRAERLKKAAAESGRTVEELEEEEDAKQVVRKQKRERAEKEKAEAEEKRRSDWVAQDAAAFLRDHPDVDIAKLDANEKFRRFCGSRYGREPLSELYADWQELVGESAAAKAVEKSAKKAERSTGAGGGGASDGLTAAQQRELDEWNRNYPQMKMTAKEFFER